MNIYSRFIFLMLIISLAGLTFKVSKLENRLNNLQSYSAKQTKTIIVLANGIKDISDIVIALSELQIKKLEPDRKLWWSDESPIIAKLKN